MTTRYHVQLDIFRGSSLLPVARRKITLPGDSALDACCRAQDLVNLQVADNEYANASSAWPLREPEPMAAQPMAEAA